MNSKRTRAIRIMAAWTTDLIYWMDQEMQPRGSEIGARSVGLARVEPISEGNRHVAGYREMQALLNRAKADASATDELWERYRPALRRMIGLRLDQAVSRRVDASDVVQDVLFKADQRLAEYLRNPVLPFHLWLRQIARDHVINAHRRHRGSARRTVDRERSRRGHGTSDSLMIVLARSGRAVEGLGTDARGRGIATRAAGSVSRGLAPPGGRRSRDHPAPPFRAAIQL